MFCDYWQHWKVVLGQLFLALFQVTKRDTALFHVQLEAVEFLSLSVTYFTPVSGVSAWICFVNYVLSITVRCSAIDAAHMLACSRCKEIGFPGMEIQTDGRNPVQTQALPLIDNLVVTSLTRT